jgi:hypothetical protein
LCFATFSSCGTAEDTYDLVLNHIQELRKHPFLVRAWFIYAPERNMAHEAGHIWHNIKDKDKRIVPICEKDNGNPGIWTDRRKKVRYALSAREKIKTGNVKVLNHLIVTNRHLPQKTRSEDMFIKLIEQLKRYRQVDTETLDPNSLMRTGVSGVVNKYGKKDNTARDDLAFTFTMNMGVCDTLMERGYKNFNYSVIPNLI